MNVEMKLSIEDIEALAEKVVQGVAMKMKASSVPDKDELLDVNGLSTYLGVRASWVYKQTKENSIPFVKMGKYLRFRRSAIDKWVNSRRVN
jgi:excisionase family DNA binding protein